tara:strand:+ start:324 stop:584 length:261 start_codon:yes stop_codon:yes gene_type:complete
MTTTNTKIAQQLFKNAIDLMKQEAFKNPENVNDTRVIANLAAKHVKWDVDEAYYIISMLLEEVNDKEVAGKFNRLPEVHASRWDYQ